MWRQLYSGNMVRNVDLSGMRFTVITHIFDNNKAHRLLVLSLICVLWEARSHKPYGFLLSDRSRSGHLSSASCLFVFSASQLGENGVSFPLLLASWRICWRCPLIFTQNCWLRRLRWSQMYSVLERLWRMNLRVENGCFCMRQREVFCTLWKGRRKKTVQFDIAK